MVFTDAGAEWRGAGCSMCLGMNPDQLAPGRAQRLDLQPQLRGPAGQGRPHPPGLRAGRRRHRRPRHPLLARRPGPLERTTVMEAFTTHTGVGVPLRRSNVDTDQIIPAVYLKRVTRTGFEDGLFAAWRDDPDFVLNNPAYAAGSVLVAGPDFGTGSSREHAVWALQNYGFRVVISLALRRHLPRQLRQGRTARRAGRREGRAAAVGPARGPTRSDRSPSTSSRARCVPARAIGRDRGLLRHRRLHPLAAARGARRHRDHAGSRGRHHGLRGDPAVVQACHSLSSLGSARTRFAHQNRVSTSIDAKIPKRLRRGVRRILVRNLAFIGETSSTGSATTVHWKGS